jgi:hypothetical protein
MQTNLRSPGSPRPFLKQSVALPSTHFGQRLALAIRRQEGKHGLE